MDVSRCCRSSRWLLLFLLSLSRSAGAEATSRAALTCLLGSGELLGGSEPAPVEEPPWQGLASLRRGDESRAQLALATADVGTLPGLTTSAVLRLELDLSGRTTTEANGLRDASSSLGLTWQFGPAAALSLRAFPFDTNYLRVGYLHALDWGGTDAALGESTFLAQNGSVPGLQAGYQTPRTALFLALKWAETDDALRGKRRLWGALSSGRLELLPTLRLEGGFGYFQRPALTPIATPSSFVEGASLRVVWHHGASEPELSAEPFRPASFAEEPTRFDAEPRPGLAFALEGVTLVQRLRRFENPDSSSLTSAPALAVYGSARGRSLAAHAAFSLRSLAFVLRNDARLAQGETLPVGAIDRAELSAWLGASATLRPLSLIPSFELAVRVPAAVEAPSTLPGFSQTLVVGGPAGLQALPIGAGRLPVVSGRLGVRFQASASVALALFGDYERNPNRVAFSASALGVTRSFARPDSLAVFSAAQARF